MDSIDHRMLDVPSNAHRIAEDEAAHHPSPWIRRNVGLGTVDDYVIAFQAGNSWWTLLFDRMRDSAAGAEVWKVASYSNTSSAWERRYSYRPDQGRWHDVVINVQSKPTPARGIQLLIRELVNAIKSESKAS